MPPGPFRLLLVWFALAAAAHAAPAQPANIVFILADDLGVDWLGCYGSDQRTPNIDRLAARGVRFETAWTSPICTPSRVMLLTGKYPGRTGWTEHFDVPRWGGAGLEPDRFDTWPQRLRAAGYATAIVGKWQINDLRPDPAILARHGFERHCVWPGVESDNPASVRRYWDAYLQTDGARRVHTGEYGPDVTHAFALEFVRRHRDQSFLLFYSAIAVHGPHEPTPPDRQASAGDETARYAASLAYLDGQIGGLMSEIDRLGLTERTAVIFCGDNGSPIAGSVGGRCVTPGKGVTTNRGMQVPLVIRSPGATKTGVASELVDFTDLFPTVCELAGLSDKNPGDGRSLVPLLQGRSFEARSWIYAQRDQSRAARNQRFKLDDAGRLFDLRADPEETRPVAAANADAQKARQELSAALASVPAEGAPPFVGYTPERMRAFERELASRTAPKVSPPKN